MYPFVQDDPDNIVDQAALSQFTCDTTNLPWVIFRAAFRAEHLSELPARARALLAALARTVDAERPYAAIFARRELLTGRALQSMRTFYRGLDDLESAALIHRPPQRRLGEVGLFGRAYLHLTPKAATLLGLVETESAERVAEVEVSASNVPATEEDRSTVEPDAPQRTAAIDVAASNVPTMASGLPSANVADGGIYKDLYPTAFQKRQPGKLPADLERLRTLGFRKFLIFKLMREARHEGKRLSDVVDVSWEHLRQAHAPIAYLRKLLSVPVDFAFQRQAQLTATLEAQAAARDAEHVRETIARCAGRTFFDTQAQRRFRVATDSATLSVLDAREASERVAISGWQSDFVAGLDAGKISGATAELAEQFEAQRAQAVQSRATVPPALPGRIHANAPACAPREAEARNITPTMSENLARMKSLVAAIARRGSLGAMTSRPACA